MFYLQVLPKVWTWTLRWTRQKDGLPLPVTLPPIITTWTTGSGSSLQSLHEWLSISPAWTWSLSLSVCMTILSWRMSRAAATLLGRIGTVGIMIQRHLTGKLAEHSSRLSGFQNRNCVNATFTLLNLLFLIIIEVYRQFVCWGGACLYTMCLCHQF